MRTETVTLTLTFDDHLFGEPQHWPWSALLGLPASAVKAITDPWDALPVVEQAVREHHFPLLTVTDDGALQCPRCGREHHEVTVVDVAQRWSLGRFDDGDLFVANGGQSNFDGLTYLCPDTGQPVGLPADVNEVWG